MEEAVVVCRSIIGGGHDSGGWQDAYMVEIIMCMEEEFKQYKMKWIRLKI